MDTNLTQRRQGLEEKIPDIKKTLSMVEYLQERRVSSLATLFVLFGVPAKTINRKAKVKPIQEKI